MCLGTDHVLGAGDDDLALWDIVCCLAVDAGSSDGFMIVDSDVVDSDVVDIVEAEDSEVARESEAFELVEGCSIWSWCCSVCS